MERVYVCHVLARKREREREQKILETGLSDSLKGAGSVGQCAGVEAAGLHSVHTVCRHQLHTAVYAIALSTPSIQ